MTFKSLCVSACLAALLPVATQAATYTFDIDALTANVNGAGQATISLNAGDAFTVSVDPLDTWSLGAPPRNFDANGYETTLGFSYGAPSMFGQQFQFGTLVARIGASPNPFFQIGTSFSGVAAISGVLNMFNWDTAYGDNSGFLRVTITTPDTAAVPLPATALLLLGALGGMAGLRRRKA